MPRIKRWFPVSQSINQDPEIWEMTRTFGERALRVWLEILSIGDRNEGVLKGSIEGWAGVLAAVYSERNPRWVRRDLETLQRLLRWLSERGLIVVRDGSESCQTGFLKLSEAAQRAIRQASNPSLVITNYAKYHKTWELDKIPVGTPLGSLPSEPSDPILTRPINTSSAEPEKKRSGSTVKEFPDQWKWLENLVSKQNGGFPKERFLDFAWWDAVSYTCGGLSQDFLEREFAGIRRWIMDNPQREPTPRGYRKFVAGWLARSYEKERRFNAQGTKQPIGRNR